MNERLEDIKQNPKRYLKSLAMDLIVVLVAAAYILYQMIQLESQQLNPLIIIAESAMSILCGVLIKQSLGENGFSKGYNSDFWNSEEDKYNAACNKANPYVERIDNFYLCEELERRKRYRREHLQAVRLKYDMWFDNEGNYIASDEMFDKLTRGQKHMVKKCVKVKIYVLNLFSEYGTSSEQDTKKEITDKVQRGKNIARNTISATLIALVGVYFLPVLTMSWSAFIAATMQVALWILLGVVQLYKNYAYVIQDKVAILKTKKELIQKFISGCEQGLYLISPYDEVQQIKPNVVTAQLETQDAPTKIIEEQNTAAPIAVEEPETDY